MLQITNATALTMVANMLANVNAGNFKGVLTGAYLLLFTEAAKRGPDATLADLTEANFAGYARQALVPLGAPYITTDDRAAQDFQALNFQATDAVNPNMVIGIGMVSALVGGNLLALELLPVPLGFASAGNGATILPRVELPPTADWGESVTAA